MSLLLDRSNSNFLIWFLKDLFSSLTLLNYSFYSLHALQSFVLFYFNSMIDIIVIVNVSSVAGFLVWTTWCVLHLEHGYGIFFLPTIISIDFLLSIMIAFSSLLNDCMSIPILKALLCLFSLNFLFLLYVPYGLLIFLFWSYSSCFIENKYLFCISYYSKQ